MTVLMGICEHSDISEGITLVATLTVADCRRYLSEFRKMPIPHHTVIARAGEVAVRLFALDPTFPCARLILSCEKLPEEVHRMVRREMPEDKVAPGEVRPSRDAARRRPRSAWLSDPND